MGFKLGMKLGAGYTIFEKSLISDFSDVCFKSSFCPSAILRIFLNSCLLRLLCVGIVLDPIRRNMASWSKSLRGVVGLGRLGLKTKYAQDSCIVIYLGNP